MLPLYVLTVSNVLWVLLYPFVILWIVKHSALLPFRILRCVASLPFPVIIIIALLIALLLLTYIPGITMLIPNLIY